jgi:hypothetical protein
MTTNDPPTNLGRLGGIFALLYGSHPLADYWVQTNHQAATKGGDGWAARRACAAHVATLTATHALALAAGTLATGERIPIRRAGGGLAFNAATHYVIDRRQPMRRLTEVLASIGKPDFHDVGKPRPGRDDNPCLGTGAHVLDQALHIACLAVTAGWIARPERGVS